MSMVTYRQNKTKKISQEEKAGEGEWGGGGGRRNNNNLGLFAQLNENVNKLWQSKNIADTEWDMREYEWKSSVTNILIFSCRGQDMLSNFHRKWLGII